MWCRGNLLLCQSWMLAGLHQKENVQVMVGLWNYWDYTTPDKIKAKLIPNLFFYVYCFFPPAVTVPLNVQPHRQWMLLQPRGCGTSALQWWVWLKHNCQLCFHLYHCLLIWQRTWAICFVWFIMSYKRALQQQRRLHHFEYFSTGMQCLHYVTVFDQTQQIALSLYYSPSSL